MEFMMAPIHHSAQNSTPTIHLPHTRESVELDLLLAVCSELTYAWRGTVLGAGMAPMPVYNTAKGLGGRLQANPEYAYSFDVACRLVSRRRNTMQATTVFFDNENNRPWFRKIRCANGLQEADGTRKNVNCALFTPLCLDYWATLPQDQRDRAQARAQALLNADAEISGGHVPSEIIPLLPARPVPPGSQAAAGKPVELGPNPSRPDIVHALVGAIHEEPFQAMHRKKPTGDASVTGWDARLRSYHWPNPKAGYEHTSAELDKLARRAESLARALAAHGAWNAMQEMEAVRVADDIFAWGGVPQAAETVTPANVRAVFASALANDPRSQAPMNSGWTKVAAFATAHLELEGGKPQVIWDSRVATSLIGRLDRLLAQRPEADRAALFADIGNVPGRGGSRPRALSLAWPGGYQRWATQVSGSALVREMRDVLNAPRNGYPRMPLPGGQEGAWTTRGVEMVLFMDGY